MKIGQSAELRRAISPEDVAAYTALSGHETADQAVPEPLINALFSYLLGVKLPGRGTNYLKQQTAFLKDAEVGQTLVARVEITRLRPEKQLVDLRTLCQTEDGQPIADGRALVYVEDVER
ncbi:MAG: phosphate acetyltransferase [Gammaproteobacteria bacterium]|nr:phosphate acetyltransferase [Gammaproteobacteria bacterium]